jgi:hypothetical protein
MQRIRGIVAKNGSAASVGMAPGRVRLSHARDNGGESFTRT